MTLSRTNQNGFTLLELLVVLVILAMLVGLVSPYVSIDSDKDLIKTESQTLRFVLQTTADQSWIDGKNSIVVRNVNSGLDIWQKVEGEWQKRRTLYQLPKRFLMKINTDNRQVEDALDVLDFKSKGEFLFLSSGEYTPFELTLTLNDRISVISGDGVNEILME